MWPRTDIIELSLAQGFFGDMQQAELITNAFGLRQKLPFGRRPRRTYQYLFRVSKDLRFLPAQTIY